MYNICMEKKPITPAPAIQEYLEGITGSDTVSNAQVIENPQQGLLSRRWFLQGLLGLTGAGGLRRWLDPCPSPPCKYKMGD